MPRDKKVTIGSKVRSDPGLPDEMWMQCLSYLQPADLIRVSETCFHLERLAKTGSLWPLRAETSSPPNHTTHCSNFGKCHAGFELSGYRVRSPFCTGSDADPRARPRDILMARTVVDDARAVAFARPLKRARNGDYLNAYVWVETPGIGHRSKVVHRSRIPRCHPDRFAFLISTAPLRIDPRFCDADATVRVRALLDSKRRRSR